jgi:hypothetical protein
VKGLEPASSIGIVTSFRYIAGFQECAPYRAFPRPKFFAFALARGAQLVVVGNEKLVHEMMERWRYKFTLSFKLGTACLT